MLLIQYLTLTLPIAGTNPGEAFGHLGIGVYGKNWLTGDGRLRVEFKYRSTARQKKVKVVRLSVVSPEEGDNVIRKWLIAMKQNITQKLTRMKSKSKTCLSIDEQLKNPNLFMRPIDNAVLEFPYHEHQNQLKTVTGKNGGATLSAGGSTPVVRLRTQKCMVKLKRARYALQKREEREEAKHQHDLQVRNY